MEGGAPPTFHLVLLAFEYSALVQIYTFFSGGLYLHLGWESSACEGLDF